MIVIATPWVFLLYLVLQGGSNGLTGPMAASWTEFKPDGRLGPYPTRHACDAARRAIFSMDDDREHYFLGPCEVLGLQGRFLPPQSGYGR